MNERRNIKLVIAYNGAAYHGWQRQAKGIVTVQQQIEDIATPIAGHRVILFGAGRTDAGVHAAGQVANFYTTNFSIPMKGLRRALNSRLDRDIAIRSAEIVPNTFHSSRSATGKTYRYRIHTAPHRPVELYKLTYHYWRSLDVERMQAAATRLIGTHDFRGFATSADIRDNTVRTIRRCEVHPDECGMSVSVEGDGFLYNMVRNIVGTLVDVGRERLGPEQIDKVLATTNRKDAGPCAPPDGLSLMCVHYRPEDLLLTEKQS